MNEIILATLALLVVITGGWYYYTQHEASEIVLLGDVNCADRAAACVLARDGFEIGLILPTQMVPLEAFPVRVKVQGDRTSGIDAVTVDFVMRGMDMGVNRYRFTRDDDGLWSGQAILPVCVTGRSDWQAVVTLHEHDTVMRARFGFEVDSH